MSDQSKTGFVDQPAFLANDYPSPIKIKTKGQMYKFTCVEAAFQGLKHPDQIAKFQDLSAEQAVELGRAIPARPDWEKVQFNIMKTLVKAKFDQNPDLKKALIETMTSPIVNHSTDTGDLFWGKSGDKGLNNLGRILEQTRDNYIRDIANDKSDEIRATAAQVIVDRREGNFAYMRHVPEYMIENFSSSESQIYLPMSASPSGRNSDLHIHTDDIQASEKEGFADIRLYRAYKLEADSRFRPDEAPAPDQVNEPFTEYFDPEEVVKAWNKYGAMEMQNIPEDWVVQNKDGKTIDVNFETGDGVFKVTMDKSRLLPGTDYLGRQPNKPYKTFEAVNLEMFGRDTLEAVYTKNDGSITTGSIRPDALLDIWNPRQVTFDKDPADYLITQEEPKAAVRVSRNVADLNAAAENLTEDKSAQASEDLNY